MTKGGVEVMIERQRLRQPKGSLEEYFENKAQTTVIMMIVIIMIIMMIIKTMI